MDCQLLVDYLQDRYKIVYSSLSYFNGIYYADLGITIPDNPFALSAIYSCGADTNKKMAILKAIVEIIERVIFISPLVGPIDFIDNVAYIRDDKNQLLPIEKISPYFSSQAVFSSKGLACHTDVSSAKHWAKMEYYEKKILENLNFLDLKLIDEVNPQNFNDKIAMSKNIDEFDSCVLLVNRYFFAVFWHKSYPEYLLGSACAGSEELAWCKAFIEANGKWDKIEKNACQLVDIADHKLVASIKAGKYYANFTFEVPHIIRRHHQILSDLNLFMVQCV